MNLSEKELWRLTIREFLQLYQAYKDTFDLELSLRLAHITYAKAEEQQMAQEEWF